MLTEQIGYDLLPPDEAEQASKMVVAIFGEHVAPGLSDDGVFAFKKYADPVALQERMNAGAFVLAARYDDRLIGLIEVRDNSHVGLLFVLTEFQGLGVGRTLLNRAIDICCNKDTELQRMTVNSSLNSVHAYLKLGFKKTDDEQSVHGIRFTPMELVLSR